jgi:hypothetical protein
MWVEHTPTQDRGVYLSSVDIDNITVWSKNKRAVCQWANKDVEVVLDNSSSDEFSEMLYVMVKHKDCFKKPHLLTTCLDTIEFYLSDERLAHENMEERLRTMQEVLYYALGDLVELGSERDDVMRFIHSDLPNLMIGALMGFKLGSVIGHLREESEEPPEKPEIKVPVVRRRRGCLFC